MLDLVESGIVDYSVMCGNLKYEISSSSEELIEYSNLVDPASSHMLVSKIKPCMSKYKQSIR